MLAGVDSFPFSDNELGLLEILRVDHHSQITGSSELANASLQVLALNSGVDSRLLQLVHDQVGFDVAGGVVGGFDGDVRCVGWGW